MWPQPPTRDYRIRFLPDPVLVRASCEDTGCEWRRDGWETVVDESTPLGREQAAWIRGYSGRKYRETREGGLTRFEFDPGQDCFAEHGWRPARALVTQGRALIREHTSLAGIAEDYTEHVGRLAEQQERG